jgi:CheY-like chemotaxis protein
MLQRILFNKQIQSDVAENGIEAVEVFLRNPNKYSLVFMDNLMPEMVSSHTFSPTHSLSD